MKYSNVSGGNGLIQFEEHLCKLGAGGISGDTGMLKMFATFNNLAMKELTAEAMSVVSGVSPDDFNRADYPEAPITMVAGQADYTLPVAATGDSVATCLRIDSVFLKKGGERTSLDYMGQNDKQSGVPGVPDKFTVDGKSIFFNRPFSSAALTEYNSMFYVRFRRIPEPFAYDDTDVEIGIISTAHELIGFRASAMYFLPFDIIKYREYMAEYRVGVDKMKRDLANFVGQNAKPRRFMPKMESNK